VGSAFVCVVPVEMHIVTDIAYIYVNASGLNLEV
jgi:hypothetical protein